MKFDLQHEPIRVPAWIYAVLVAVAIPLAVDLLSGKSWRDAIPVALIAAGAIIAPAEAKRARVDSPATIERRRVEAQAHLTTEH